jgi:hypothetical protein
VTEALAAANELTDARTHARRVGGWAASSSFDPALATTTGQAPARHANGRARASVGNDPADTTRIAGARIGVEGGGREPGAFASPSSPFGVDKVNATSTSVRS